MGAASSIALHCIAEHSIAEQSRAEQKHWQVAGAKASSMLNPHQRLTKSEAGAPCYLLPIISHAIKSPVLTLPSNIWSTRPTNGTSITLLCSCVCLQLLLG